MHLKYEKRICPKNYDKVTMTLYFYYEIECIRVDQAQSSSVRFKTFFIDDQNLKQNHWHCPSKGRGYGSIFFNS
jgi:hypothetical protein